MKNKLLKLFIFFCGLFILLEAVSFLFIPNKSNLLKYGYFKKANYDILSEPNDSIDIVFLGDSIIYNGISPMHIWKNYGYTSYDCAIPAATMDELYKYAQIAVDSQHPKLVMFDADTLYRNPHTVHKMKIKMKSMRNIIPLFAFHNNWKQLFSDNWVNQYKGYKYSSKVKGPKHKPMYHKTDKVKEITAHNIEVFNNMIKLFNDNDVKVIMIEVPNIYWNHEKHNAAVKLAKENNIELFNVNEVEFGLNWQTDTKDDGVHMNYKGSQKLSDYVAEFIKSKNIVTDHRKDSKYDNWHRAYKIFTTTLYD